MKPNDAVKVFVQQVTANPLWKEWIVHLQKQRPVVPKYRPGLTSEETAGLLEQIKYESGRRDGFDHLLLHLTGEKPND